MSFRVQIEALRRHATALEAQSDAWGDGVRGKVVYGDIGLSTNDVTMAGGDLLAAYEGVCSRYAEYTSAASEALYLAANMLRRAADTYGDTDSIIADTF